MIGMGSGKIECDGPCERDETDSCKAEKNNVWVRVDDLTRNLISDNAPQNGEVRMTYVRISFDKNEDK